MTATMDRHYTNEILGQMAKHPSEASFIRQLCPHEYITGDELFVDRHDVATHEAIKEGCAKRHREPIVREDVL